jgi:signal transduction histidine kinase
MPGGGSLYVRTFCHKDAGKVVLEVIDHGSGITAENLPRIFDPFFTTKGVGKGVGLGLAVVYGIVAAHGGEIKVETEVDRGTTFRVTLPIAAGGSTPGPPTAPDGSTKDDEEVRP